MYKYSIIIFFFFVFVFVFFSSLLPFVSFSLSLRIVLIQINKISFFSSFFFSQNHFFCLNSLNNRSSKQISFSFRNDLLNGSIISIYPHTPFTIHTHTHMKRERKKKEKERERPCHDRTIENKHFYR